MYKSINMKIRKFKNVKIAKNYLARFSKIAKNLKKEIDCKISYDCKTLFLGVVRK